MGSQGTQRTQYPLIKEYTLNHNMRSLIKGYWVLWVLCVVRGSPLLFCCVWVFAARGWLVWDSVRLESFDLRHLDRLDGLDSISISSGGGGGLGVVEGARAGALVPCLPSSLETIPLFPEKGVE